ncbi:MAG: hypothetical protein Q9212_001773 [Teloschistes hypoglaucus]
MDSEDGVIFVKNLAQFVRIHEKALANALHLRQRNAAQAAEVVIHPLGAPPLATSASAVSNALVAALSFGALNFKSQSIKPAKLTLTPHHLFYLLSRFEDIGVPVGPLNVRTENLHAEASPANYVSFLGHSHTSRGRGDRDSIHSVKSVRSVMSGMSALWLGLGSANSNAKSEKAQTQLMLDLKYLYSAFTKIPCLQLSPDRTARLIRGYEEFPFDTAVPLHSFKNLSALDICDVDFRQFFGWDKLADQLRSLTLKRANVDNPVDLLTNIVLDDTDKRRRRSSKAQSSPILSWPLSPPVRFTDTTRFASIPSSPAVEDKQSQSTSPKNEDRTPRFDMLGVTALRLIDQDLVALTQAHIQILLCLLPASRWRFLRHLGLADNALTSIPVNSLAPLSNSLQSLDLSSNLFTDVPDGLANLTVLRALNLSNCMVESLQSLLRNPLPAITALNLRANRLQSLVGIERLLSLERLDVRDNKLVDPTELARLTALPEFREVWIMQNPFIRSHSDYRIAIFNLFRTTPGHVDDVVIDGSSPTYSERKHLVDRVLEIEPVSIVRGAMVGSGTRAPAIKGDEQYIKLPDPTDPDTSRRGGTSWAAHQFQKPSSYAINASSPRTTQSRAIDQSASVSKRSKRSTRRQRLVDLAVDEQVSYGNVLPAVQPTLANQEPRDHLTRRKSNDIEKSTTADTAAGRQISPNDSGLSARALTREDTTDNEDETPAFRGPNRLVPHGVQPWGITESQDPRLKTHAYRHKVETLRQEVGSNWLSALSDEGWVDDKKADSFAPRNLWGCFAALNSPICLGVCFSIGQQAQLLQEGVTDMADQNEVDLDSVIDRLLEVRGSRPGKQVQLLETEIRYLCTKAREIFISQPILLELEAPIKASTGSFKGETNYLFLGDYVDRGKQSLETICLLLAYKIKYPENFFILRGNHECASINRIYGFYDECKRRYNIKLWKTFTDCFNCLPIAAIIDEKIFTMHGGLSPDLNSMEQIRRVMRPTDIPDCGLLCDLLWSDPDKDITGWSENDRGVSFTFGPDVVSRFLQKHDMDLICRAHQVVEDGYEFFSKRQLVTLFSAPNYCGEFDNAGAMMSVDESLLCSFQSFQRLTNFKSLDLETSGEETKVRLRWHEHWQAHNSSKEAEEEVNMPTQTPLVQQVRAEIAHSHVFHECVPSIEATKPPKTSESDHVPHDYSLA